MVDATDGDGVLVTVRRGKTNDVRYLKNGAACVIRALRAATSPEPGDCVVPLSAQMIGLRFTAEAAGVEHVDHRRDARRQLEGLADGRALHWRCDRRAKRRGALCLTGFNEYRQPTIVAQLTPVPHLVQEGTAKVLVRERDSNPMALRLPAFECGSG